MVKSDRLFFNVWINISDECLRNMNKRSCEELFQLNLTLKVYLFLSESFNWHLEIPEAPQFGNYCSSPSLLTHPNNIALRIRNAHFLIVSFFQILTNLLS
jgi:hypothetical protein